MNLSPEALLLLFAACHFFVVWLVCSPDQTNRADWGIKKLFFYFLLTHISRKIIEEAPPYLPTRSSIL